MLPDILAVLRSAARTVKRAALNGRNLELILELTRNPFRGSGPFHRLPMAIGLPARPSGNSSANAANFSTRGIVALFGRGELRIANLMSDQNRRHCFGRSKSPLIISQIAICPGDSESSAGNRQRSDD
jgi:hypothetical protein